jgi:hypothetical protein
MEKEILGPRGVERLNKLTTKLIPYSRVLEKLPVAQLLQDFPVF